MKQDEQNSPGAGGDGGLLRRDVLRGAAAIAAIGIGRSARAQGTKTIRLGVHKSSIYAPALLLQSYLPADIKIELSYFAVPADMTNAMLAGSLDGGYTGVTIAALGRTKGQPIAIVSNAGERGSAIIVRADSGIQSFAELKGKKIGVQPGGIQDILFRMELKKAGLAASDVQAIRMTSPDMAPALQRGDIVAFSGNEPMSSQTVKDGYGRVLMYPYDNPVGGINGAILTTESKIRSDGAVMKQVVLAHRKASEELTADPDRWAKITSDNWGFNLETTRASLSNVALRWRLDQAFLAQYKAYMEQLKEVGFLESVPDPASFVHTEFTPA